MADLLDRHSLPWAREALETFPALFIEGARQVGKSTFAQMLVADRPSTVTTLDRAATREAARRDPEAFVDQVRNGTLVIDEIQRAPELLLAIKAAIDEDRRPGRFVLTGSSDLLRLERTPDSLAGRAVTIPLRGLSQGEIGGRREDFVSWFLDEEANPRDVTTTIGRADYAAILAAGGYPEPLHLTGRGRGAWFEDYLRRIVQRDALDVRRLVDSSRLRSVLRFLAANQSGELVKARVARDSDIPETSITSYIDVLETLFLIEKVRPWTPNLTSREAGKPKVSVSDPALAMHLGPVTPAQLTPVEGGELLGPLLEGLVVSELRKQAEWSAYRFRLFHYRDRAGVEVDIVLELPDGRILGIEVKASQTPKPDHFKGLDFLAGRLGDRFAGGVVLNTAKEGFQYARGLWGLPIASLWQV